MLQIDKLIRKLLESIVAHYEGGEGCELFDLSRKMRQHAWGHAELEVVDVEAEKEGRIHFLLITNLGDGKVCLSLCLVGNHLVPQRRGTRPNARGGVFLVILLVSGFVSLFGSKRVLLAPSLECLDTLAPLSRCLPLDLFDTIVLLLLLWVLASALVPCDDVILLVLDSIVNRCHPGITLGGPRAVALVEQADTLEGAPLASVHESRHARLLALVLEVVAPLPPLVSGRPSDVASSPAQVSPPDVIKDRLKGPGFALEGGLVQPSVAFIVAGGGRDAAIVEAPPDAVLLLGFDPIEELLCLVPAATALGRHRASL
mmetsp:Transcript_25552/g.59273  ORF Transcript_25552/g.59273 Transcript_25552/m.59273 type:complete len:315 (+) Transcript_25552:546-1490(+)